MNLALQWRPKGNELAVWEGIEMRDRIAGSKNAFCSCELCRRRAGGDRKDPEFFTERVLFLPTSCVEFHILSNPILELRLLYRPAYLYG